LSYGTGAFEANAERRKQMTIHSKMFDGKEEKERTYHRIYVEFEGGYFISLGVIDSEFQRMVKEHGGPNIVEFRDTDEKWNIDDEGEELISGVSK
jgi:hypothetical protein